MKVLAISGSLRKDSYNRKLLQIAKKIASDTGAEVSEFDLKKTVLPVFDQDVEDAGMPESVEEFREAIEASDVLLISSPEYNHSIPGGLKNAIDWASRDGNSFSGKTAAIFGVSAGSHGTARMQPHLRQVLAALGVKILPQPQILLGPASKKFNSDGTFADEKTAERLKVLVEKTLASA